MVLESHILRRLVIWELAFVNKRMGLDFLKEFNLNTIELLSFEDLRNNPSLINKGLSLRLSSCNDNIDVRLPSIHNVKKIEDILTFYNKYYQNFDILMHKTIFPKEIGSISKYQLSDYNIISIETFKNFEERTKEIIKERALITLIDDRIIKIDHSSFSNKSLLREIINNIKDIHYPTYDLEFVYDNEVIFTDFYSRDFGKKLIKE